MKTAVSYVYNDSPAHDWYNQSCVGGANGGTARDHFISPIMYSHVNYRRGSQIRRPFGSRSQTAGVRENKCNATVRPCLTLIAESITSSTTYQIPQNRREAAIHNIHTHTYMHACMHTYTCIHTHTYIHTNIHTYIRTSYIHTYIHAYIHTYIHTHTYIRTYIHTYIHTYTYIHTHTHLLRTVLSNFDVECNRRAKKH